MMYSLIYIILRPSKSRVKVHGRPEYKGKSNEGKLRVLFDHVEKERERVTLGVHSYSIQLSLIFFS